MLKNIFRPLLVIGLLAGLFSIRARAQEVVPAPVAVLISVADQRLVVFRDGGWVAKYHISTSRFGTGDSFGSYKTPLGQFRVCDKVGADLANGTVIKHRVATSEVLPVNAAGRDPIVTRVIWLDGLEEQNRNAKARGIYIHGTTEEKYIGRRVSYGCIRMRSSDVAEVFNWVPVGTRVAIIDEKLPKLRKYTPAPPPVIIASNTPPAATHATPDAPAPKVVAAPAAPAPRLAANLRPAPIASGPGAIPADPGASQAMKGSILSAGLPDGPQKIGPEKKDSMTFHSWSKVSMRESDGSGRTAGTH
ncbi:MAG: L,D-transpeptidase [Chthoniobacter sp.]|nr:L,D-transpeptidase [Chthoniobacter sp.]